MYCTAQQVLQWIYRLIIDSNFIVKVRSGRAARRTDAADDISAVDLLAEGRLEPREVSVARSQTAAMVDDDQLAVTILPADEGHFAAGAGDHRVTKCGVDVLT